MGRLFNELRKGIAGLFRPRHTLQPVAQRIVNGPADGSIVPDPPLVKDDGEALPVVETTWATRAYPVANNTHQFTISPVTPASPRPPSDADHVVRLIGEAVRATLGQGPRTVSY